VIRKSLAGFILVGMLATVIWAGVENSDDPSDGLLALILMLGFAVVVLCVLVLVDQRQSE
jgi:formate hydrogenlyase subunit 4